MLMPPPNPATDTRRDRQVFHEIGQLVRAVEHIGPTTPEELGSLVGATYWEAHRFERALTFAVADGLLVSDSHGRLRATP